MYTFYGTYSRKGVRNTWKWVRGGGWWDSIDIRGK